MKVDLEKINIKNIHLTENKTRKINPEGVKTLERSMENFGLVEPILINLKENNTIISGHQRYKILYKKYENNEIGDLYLLPLGDIGWVFENRKLKLKDKLQLSLILNTHQGSFIKSKLKETLKELKLKGLDIELTGLKDIKLENIEKIEKIPKKEFKENKIKCPECGYDFNLGDKNVK